jgi:hypothetical protein
MMLSRAIWRYAMRWRRRALRAEKQCTMLVQQLETERQYRKTMAEGFFLAAKKSNQR